MAIWFTRIAAGTAVALLAAGAIGALAQEATTTAVLKSELAGDEGKEANIVVFDVAAGWETQRHIHPGHVFVYVTGGSIEVDVDGSEPTTFSAGEAFYELPDKPMVARTASAEEGASFIVFQVGPTGEPIMVPHSD